EIISVSRRIVFDIIGEVFLRAEEHAIYGSDATHPIAVQIGHFALGVILSPYKIPQKITEVHIPKIVLEHELEVGRGARLFNIQFIAVPFEKLDEISVVQISLRI